MEHFIQSSEHPQYLTFAIGSEEYAVGILRVREIIQYGGVTRVPRTPRWVRGVINLRGRVVPVLDLAVRFGLPRAETTRSTSIVITEVGLDGQPVVMGLLADAVSQVVELPAHDVQPAPPFGTKARVGYLQGMGRLGDRLVLLLNLDTLLSTDERAEATTLEADPPAESADGDEAPSRPAPVP